MIRVAGHDLVHESNLDHYRARHVGMIFQLHNLLPTLDALENVQIPMFELDLGASERKARARTLLELVELTGRERNRPPQLSGGERQRVAVARALANEPALLLADEPTGSLDSEAGRVVLDLLERIRDERGTTILLVTHDPAVAERADRLVRMLDGRLDATGPAAEPDGSARRARPLAPAYFSVPGIGDRHDGALRPGAESRWDDSDRRSE
jgi:putative ABC transport system ATP-binding protein